MPTKPLIRFIGKMFFLDVTLDIVQFHEKRNSNFMVKASEAIRLILDATENFATETILTEKASGYILREVIKAERDQPPFNRVMMDGIALSSNDYNQGQLNFPLLQVGVKGDRGDQFFTPEKLLGSPKGNAVDRNSETT